MTNVYNCVKIKSRKGLHDIWNAFMVQGANYSINDIPICPTTAQELPLELISYDDAKSKHKKNIKYHNVDYFVNAFVHFYIDDQKFDGKQSSIWLYPNKSLEILRHFAGIISPDFSTYADFPEPLKRWNFYRMYAFGYWISKQGIPVINNARWGTEETWSYCFDGIEPNSIVAIGTVASGINRLENRPLFERGLEHLVEKIHPPTILVYGSANYECFKTLKTVGINIVAYPSKTSEAFARRNKHE